MRNIYYGIPRETLQAWLTEAQGVLHKLTIGGQPQVVSYSQGDGSKGVTYTAANIGTLVEYIGELVDTLNGRRRRAIGCSF
jgi:hypothetical protein